jgi:hypothetical protein
MYLFGLTDHANLCTSFASRARANSQGYRKEGVLCTRIQGVEGETDIKLSSRLLLGTPSIGSQCLLQLRVVTKGVGHEVVWWTSRRLHLFNMLDLRQILTFSGLVGLKRTFCILCQT